jgi:hypothetical protein
MKIARLPIIIAEVQLAVIIGTQPQQIQTKQQPTKL